MSKRRAQKDLKKREGKLKELREILDGMQNAKDSVSYNLYQARLEVWSEANPKLVEELVKEFQKQVDGRVRAVGAKQTEEEFKVLMKSRWGKQRDN